MLPNMQVDFDKNEKPLCKFDKFASKHLMHILAMFSYLFPLTIGLFNYEFFMASPIVQYLSYILDFIPDEFYLCHKNDIRIAITLVILLLPISMFVIRNINNIAISYPRRRFLFFITFIFILTDLAFLRVFIISVDNRFEYIFNFFVFGIFYFIPVLVQSKKTNRLKIRKKYPTVL